MFERRFNELSIQQFLKCTIFFAAIFLSSFATTHTQVFLKNQFSNLSFYAPVGLYYPNDSTNRLCVVEQGGIIRIFPNDSSTTSSKVFLDIHTNVISGGELGLLGLAFHPHFATNGFFYVDYTRDNPLRTVISRFRVSTSNPDSADPSSEVILLVQNQPFDNHNGGQLAFGPDGYLYIAFGDGGSGGDPFGNGQNKSTLLGKILRINVDSTVGAQQYAIPPDNPFFGDITKKQEIYAYGLRNPWRFSFDGQTLWCADVGQDTWEEIDTIMNGGNYGWKIMEAMHCYSPSTGCNTTGLTLPIWEYAHSSGRCSITGGFVYRGSTIPSLAGKYIYGDYCTGEIWMLTPSSPSPSNAFLLNAGTNISSFGEDKFREIYVCDYGGGKIYKLSSTLPGPFTLVAPNDNAVNQPNIVTCTWTSSASALTYHLQVAYDSTFTSFVVNDSTLTNTTRQVGLLPDSTMFFWRVRALNANGSTELTPFRRFTTSTTLLDVHVLKRWNMLCLPLTVTDGRKTTLFPSAGSNAFEYTSATGYETRDTLFPGTGYWLKFDDSTTIGLVGTPRLIDTIDVVAGWNMIGSLSQSIPTTQIVSIPGGIVTSQFFGYQGSYIASKTIEPGQGYWVKVNVDGKLILSSSSIVSGEARTIHIVPTTERPPSPPDEIRNGKLIPKEFALEQNYPNPFNPTTHLQFLISKLRFVSLKVFDVLGREVAIIVQENLSPGVYTRNWDASRMASGIYFYRLRAGNFTDTKKLILVK